MDRWTRADGPQLNQCVSWRRPPCAPGPPSAASSGSEHTSLTVECRELEDARRWWEFSTCRRNTRIGRDPMSGRDAAPGPTIWAGPTDTARVKQGEERNGVRKKKGSRLLSIASRSSEHARLWDSGTGRQSRENKMRRGLQVAQVGPPPTLWETTAAADWPRVCLRYPLRGRMADVLGAAPLQCTERDLAARYRVRRPRFPARCNQNDF
jgi:hypothetical protein